MKLTRTYRAENVVDVPVIDRSTNIRRGEAMRNMSFSMTTDQMRREVKDVTRRFGWWFLKPSDRVMAVEKAMGLKKGEKPVRIYPIEIVSVRSEPLDAITQDDVIREGFPDWTPKQFVQMLVEHYTIDPSKIVNRIEFDRAEES